MRRGYGARGLGREEDGGETYLAGGVDDVTVVVDALVVDGLVEDALDGGVVGLDKVVLDELDDERGLAWRTGVSGWGAGLGSGCSDLPTEREPSTAIFLFLSSSPGMMGG